MFHFKNKTLRLTSLSSLRPSSSTFPLSGPSPPNFSKYSAYIAFRILLPFPFSLPSFPTIPKSAFLAMMPDVKAHPPSCSHVMPQSSPPASEQVNNEQRCRIQDPTSPSYRTLLSSPLPCPSLLLLSPSSKKSSQNPCPHC